MNIKQFASIKSLLPFGCAAILGTIPATAEQVIFTEIQYNAKAGDPDFLEITNITGTPLDIGKWYFSDGIDYTFPDFSSANPSAHIFKQFETILVSPVDEATLRGAYPNIPEETRIFGPYAGKLSNSGETLTLNDKNGVVMTSIEYNDGGKWPAAADGTGHTLTRINPNLSNAEWRNWAASENPGGTPGRGPATEDDLATFTTKIAQTTSTCNMIRTRRISTVAPRGGTRILTTTAGWKAQVFLEKIPAIHSPPHGPQVAESLTICVTSFSSTNFFQARR